MMVGRQLFGVAIWLSTSKNARLTSSWKAVIHGFSLARRDSAFDSNVNETGPSKKTFKLRSSL